LINATTISFDEVYSLMGIFHGIMIPAHIDKSSNSVLSNLGFIPEDSQFTCVELKNLERLGLIQKANPYINRCRVISNSDAHNLWGLNEPEHRIHVKEITREEVLTALTVFHE
jgi:hypothetical protein